MYVNPAGFDGRAGSSGFADGRELWDHPAMTRRAILLGLALGLFISGFTYFNDFVMKQTLLIGSFLPVSVFGVVVLLLLLGNPLLGAVRRGWPLRASEIAVITAIGLAACAYPGANFCRYFATIAAMPPHLAKNQPAWQSQQVMSYLPGGSALIAPGQVRDWAALVELVHEQRGHDGAIGRLYAMASEEDRRAWDTAFAEGVSDPRDVTGLTAAINRVLEQPAFGDAATAPGAPETVRRNRALLVEATGLVLPPPRGRHALVTGDRSDPEVVDLLVAGLQNKSLAATWGQLPWAKWWPTIRLWGGAAALLGLASLALAVVVHPQWSDREILPYPIARFVADVSRRQPGRWLPDAARSKLFWIGLGAVVVLHALNGLHAWFPQFPLHIPLRLDFNPMRVIFPNASRVALSHSVFHPMIYLSVVAFAFFISSQVSFTLGVSQLLFVGVGAVLVAQGIPMEYDKFTPNKMNMLRLGSFLGMAAMIAYTGRRYYLNVIRSALGGRRAGDTPAASVWATRLGVIAALGGGGLLTSSGLSPLMVVVLVALCLLVWLVMARIVAETGMFLIAGPFLPLGVLPGLLGLEAIGPTQLIMLGIAGQMLIIDPKESLMPFIVNGLRMTDRSGTATGRIAPVLAVMVVVSLAVSIVVTLGLQYEHGANLSDGYASRRVPSEPFVRTSRFASEALADGSLSASTALTDAQRLISLNPTDGSWWWLGLGMALVIGTAAARLRLPWWPLHPVLFLIWGTWGIAHFGFSFLLGWAIKSAVVRGSGIAGFHVVLPLAIGVIAGELLSALGWMIVGGAYHAATGVAPTGYRIFP